jgi:uncharacterized glyoxalase superfamily protein PhnB
MIQNRSKPPGTIIPVLLYPDIRKAVDWLCTAFGFQERLRIGNHRSQLCYGGGSIVVAALESEFDRKSELPVTAAHSLLVSVENADSHFEHSSKAGAEIIRPPADCPYGERQYRVVDIGGHQWTFSQTIADVDPTDWGGEMIKQN